MGVASLVLLILKVVSTESALILLSLGLVCQGFLNLEKGNKLTSKWKCKSKKRLRFFLIAFWLDDDFWSNRIVVEANQANGQEDKEKEEGGQAYKVDGGHKKEEEATDPNTGHEDGEGLVTSPVDF